MNVGDPKKAIVLSIIAVMIVCVAVFRAMPSSGPAVPQGAVALRSADPPAPKESKAEDPPVPTIDAFSHPNLGKLADPDKKGEAPATERTQQIKVDKKPWVGPPSTGDEKSIPALVDPRGITGNDQQPNVGEAVLVVRLDAIVRSDSAMAAFTVAGKSAAPCSEGTMINGHIKVVRIKDSSVVIEVMKRRYEVFMGQEVTL